MCENDGVPSVMTMWSASAASATCSDHAIVPAAVDPREDLGRPRLVERHAPRAHRRQPFGIDLDPDHTQPPVGERERQRQADPAATDDGDVVFHTSPEASGRTGSQALPLPSRHL